MAEDDDEFPAPERPADVEEDTLMDVAPLHEVDTPDEITYRLIPASSIRAKDKLFDNIGFSYIVKRTNKNETISWRCPVRTKEVRYCPASATQLGDSFTRGPRCHAHDANLGIDVAADIASEMKAKAAANPFQSASSIVKDVLSQKLTNAPCPALPTSDRLIHTTSRYRQGLRPHDPTDLEFTLETDKILDSFLQKDIKVKERRHLLFYTANQLELLARSKSWYVDATFKIVRKPFTQLFSIHAFVKHEDCAKQVPLVYCLMSGKRKSDYKAVFKAVRTCMEESQLTRIVMDFESAIWRAAASQFPDVEIKGCAFHFGQAVWRKVQDIGLRQTYIKDKDANKYIRKLMALRFLPEQYIPRMFEKLAKQATTANMIELVNYFRNTWIGTWNPENWTVYFQAVRTNNDVEGWHQALITKGRPQMPLYLLIELLHQECQQVDLQVRLVSEDKLKRIQRRKYKDLQVDLFKYWTQYEKGERTAKSLLSVCAELYGPKMD